MESYLPATERKKIFDHIDARHNGNVLVKDFLKKVEEYEFLGQEHNQELQKVRDYLALSIHQKREELASTRQLEEMTKEEATLDKQEEIERLKQTKGVANEAEKIRRALGMRTFDLDVDHEELDDLLEENFHKLPANEANRKYARFLHHSHLKLSQIPFYDMRATELDRLKHRAVSIDQILESDEIGGRFMELSKTRWNGSKATINNNADTLMPKGFQPYSGGDNESLDNSFDNHSDVEMDVAPPAAERNQMAVSKSLPNLKLSARPSPLAAAPSSPALRGPGQNLQSPLTSPHPYNSHGQPVRLEALKKLESTNNNQQVRGNSANMPGAVDPAQKTRNLVGEQTRGVEYDDMSTIQSITLSDDANSLLSNLPPSLAGAKSVAKLVASLSSPNKKPVSKLRTGLLDQQEKKIQASDFFTQIYDESTSMGRLKNPASVMRIEKIDPNVYQPSCRRSIQQGPTDWSRVGFGGTDEGGGYGDNNESDRFVTTNSKYYPPLVYEPSQPVQRHLVSEADIAARKKSFIRQQRYARKQANMEVTQTRLEYETLEKQIRSLRREQSRIEDNIRYKTSIFLDDLQQFRSQPLQRMAKRQNIELSDRMWNGNSDKQTVQLVPESRDFQTTYSNSFQSEVLKQSFNNLMGDHFQTKTAHHHDKSHQPFAHVNTQSPSQDSKGGGARPSSAPSNQ